MAYSLPSPLRALAFPALAVLCATLANGLAGPARKLTWAGWVPPALPATPPPAPPAPALSAPVLSAPVLPPANLPAQDRPGRAAVSAGKPVPPGPRFPADPSAVIRDISSRDAQDAYALGIPFLDARRSADYAEGHVPRAWSLPVWEAAPETRITEFEARANPAPRDPLVVYCSGAGCEDSHLLAGKLVALGYRNILIYTGGFPDWTAQSRPVERGTRP